MTSSNGNIFRVTGPLCGEFTGPGQWRGTLMFSLICACIKDWVNNHAAGDLRRRRGHFDVNVMLNSGYKPPGINIAAPRQCEWTITLLKNQMFGQSIAQNVLICMKTPYEISIMVTSVPHHFVQASGYADRRIFLMESSHENILGFCYIVQWIPNYIYYIISSISSSLIHTMFDKHIKLFHKIIASHICHN